MVFDHCNNIHCERKSVYESVWDQYVDISTVITALRYDREGK
jgi:hypothetical protein